MPPEEADALFGACDAKGAGVLSYTALETCLSRQKGFTDAPPTPEVSGEAPREAPREAEAEAHAEAEAEVVSEGGGAAAAAGADGDAGMVAEADAGVGVGPEAEVGADAEAEAEAEVEAGGGRGGRHPMDVFSTKAVHGGTWRCAWSVDSIARAAYVAGVLWG